MDGDGNRRLSNRWFWFVCLLWAIATFYLMGGIPPDGLGGWIVLVIATVVFLGYLAVRYEDEGRDMPMWLAAPLGLVGVAAALAGVALGGILIYAGLDSNDALGLFYMGGGGIMLIGASLGFLLGLFP
jgi:predicted Na+-dependent transporter